MNTAVLILASFVVFTTAIPQYPNSVSNPHYQASQSYSSPQLSYSAPPSQPSSSYGQPDETAPLTVFRHVYVHVAPDDQASGIVRRIKAPGGGEKHVKIIFVKAPAAAAPDQQVVEIPQAGEQKTLVYVLLKKAADAPDVSISPPLPTKPSKPEVFFIRYKDQKPAIDAASTQYGAPTASTAGSSSYGAPAPNPAGY